VNQPPLRRDVVVDEPGMVGARWWQDSVVDPVSRRAMLTGLLGAGVAVAVVAGGLAECEPTKSARRQAIELQRQYGWSFGASSEGLVFNGSSTEPFDPSRLDRMPLDLAPRSSALRPYYVQTLFEAPSALPRAVAEGEDGPPPPPLKQALRPILTSSMRDAYAWARRFAESLASIPGACLVVDLDGPDSVAFAAGASPVFDPVFLFDNWPHPHGVVPAHLTLAAAAYYQPLFAQPGPVDSPPMFVLDRKRLAPYSDDAAQFDNRWVARMPSAGVLWGLGVRKLFYITAIRQSPRELDDLNDDLVAAVAAGISIVAIALSGYPLDAQGSPASSALSDAYTPVPRRTPFSSEGIAGAHATPQQFGSVPVVVSAFRGTVIDVGWNRSGSWNRGWTSGG
jgi:hypothetical protein